jgi:hypothetical protein
MLFNKRDIQKLHLRLLKAYTYIQAFRKTRTKRGVGEFRKTHHPRNVEFNKVLETCFSGVENSRFSEAWNL